MADHNGDNQVDADDLEAIKQELLEEFGEAVSEPADHRLRRGILALVWAGASGAWRCVPTAHVFCQRRTRKAGDAVRHRRVHRECVLRRRPDPALRRAGPLFILSARLACCRGFSACGILECREAMRENRHTSELIYFVTQED